MKYNSTRDNSVSYCSAEAIKRGLAPDGGLFVPSDIPKISQGEIVSMIDKSYPEKAAFVLSRFLTDYSEEELLECTQIAYGKEKWASDSIVPLHKIDERTFFQEQFHGPTCAFKDFALQMLPQLLPHAIEKTGDSRDVLILVATSGDTGKAALAGFQDVARTRIVSFFPENGVSEIQKLHMVTQDGQNVGVCPVIGNFDDTQTGVKAIFSDSAYREELSNSGFLLSSANSINWGRLSPQIAYHFSAYCDMVKSGEIKMGQKINILIPSANGGNIMAAYFAKEMGVPIAKLILACNKNNALTNCIRTGEYNINREFYLTGTPAMDILISSNFERMIYMLSDRNAAQVAEWMKQLRTEGKYVVSDKVKQQFDTQFWSSFCDDTSVAESIKDTYEKHKYLIDPHTAVGKKVYDRYIAETGDTTKTVLSAVASPFKFPKFVSDALGMDTEGKDEFNICAEVSEKTGLAVPQTLVELKNKQVRFAKSYAKSAMKAYVNSFVFGQ